MEYTPLHRYFIFNGEIESNKNFRVFEKKGGVYEVLRVVAGVPLFLEDHLERFFISASIAQKSIRFSKVQISAFLYRLIEQNKVDEGNILLACKTNLVAFFIPHKYPEKQLYETGITCDVLKAERENPNAKVFQTTVRQQANELIEQRGLYEVLLVDHQNCITEGSRSNVFFVKGNCLITPPGNGVLLGITRQKTIALAKNEHIPFYEQDIRRDDLPEFQAAFITGTSPNILPIAQVGDRKFDLQNPIVLQLRNSYDKLVLEYISKKKKLPE
ncbi:branched-chain amino acid aminotransferase [Mariniphaga anaerophila]|uniref:branched-chain-amino-acid transaminase n=1 Tax=Mariniphaga anaerophila TaxID=1484053 RepID=A0A1M4XND7_9BACT|nr:aminotransferase class IV [Mariniphaga anaerophila]SHE94930.1 branched-chain amino acid aminotransferase [Mariniphaga anaerophila]